MKTLNKIFWILLLSLAASPLFGQTTIDTFVQKVEGAAYLDATVQAADGGYVTVSTVGANIDETSFLVRKIKVSGQKQWERRLYIHSSFPSIRGIAQTTDGGFVLVGEAGFYEPTRSQATLVKLRPNGTVAWKKSFGVSGQAFNRFSSAIATPDGGVIAIGAIAADPLVVRFTATGDVVWGKSFKRIAAVFPYIYPLITSTATTDNDFIVAFPTSTNVSNQHLDGLDVMKITNSGIVVWEKLLKTGSAFVFRSAGATADGGVMIVGSRKNSKLKIVVLKADGTLNWKAGYFLKAPGGIQSVSSPIQTPDGGFVLTGGSYVTLSKKNYGFIAKIDSSRKVAFQNTFGNGPAVGRSIFITADGSSLLFGSIGRNSFSSGLLVSKVNSEGVVPGCSFFQSFGSTKRTSFGRLRMNDIDKTESDDLTVEPGDFELTSVVSNIPVSTVCQ